MENCSRCEELPELPDSKGKFLLSLPLEHTMRKIASVFREQDHSYEIKSNEILFTTIDPNALKSMSKQLQEKLSEDEIQDIQALFMEKDQEISLTHISRMEPLENFLAKLESEWLIDVLREDRLDNVFQPIIRADDPSSIHGYECLLRAYDEDGGMISPGRIFGAARNSELMFQLDRDSRITAVRNSRELPDSRKIFINFMPTSIYDPEYCLKTTVEAIDEVGLDKDQIVFEVVETEEIDDLENLINILEYYRERGVDVALDDLGAGYSSLNLLTKLRPNYIKLDMKLVQSVLDNDLNKELARSLLRTARDNDILTIAEGIETEDQSSWFVNNGVDFMQGYYFAEPTQDPDRKLSSV